MLNKKLIMLAIFLVSLFVVSAVSAADNATEGVVDVTDNGVEDVFSVEETSEDIINVGEANETMGAEENNIVVSLNDNDEPLNTGSYLKEGPFGYIDSNDMTIKYKNPIEYKVQLVGTSVNGQSVSFIVYKGESGQHYGDYKSTTDSNGYAILNADLKPDVYWINIISDNHGSVYNTLTVKNNGYTNAKIDISSPYYGYDGGDINYHWKGDFKGYFNLYKGNKLIHKKYLSLGSKGVVSDGDYGEYVYLTKKLSIGTYTVKITNSNGKVIKKASFKVSKIPTYVYCKSIKAKSGTKKVISAKVYNKINDWCSGKVKFKINGKTYKTKLKNGEAKIKIKLPSKAKTYKCKVTFLGNKNNKKSSKTFKITVKKQKSKKKTIKKKKSSGKKFTLKLNAPEKYSEKKIKGNHIYAFYKYRNQGQAGRGVCIDSYGKGGPGTLKGIKLIKAKIYFKSNNGNTKVKTERFDKYGFTKSDLISGYKPYKVVVFYK